MNEQEFKDRTKKFGVRIITVVAALPRGLAAEVIGRQLLRAGTSVGANYRAACRGRSSKDVISRLNRFWILDFGFWIGGQQNDPRF